MNTTPNLLFVSPRFLFPLDEGGKIRTAGILRAMKDSGAFHTTLVSPAPGHSRRFAAEIESVCNSFASWPERRPGRLSRLLTLLGRFPVSARSEMSQDGRRLVAAERKNGVDVIVIDYPQSVLLAPQPFGFASVLFTHNVEAEILERHAAVAGSPMRTIWRHEAAKMRRFEQAALQCVDTVVAVSARDAKSLRERYGSVGIETIDTGVDLDYYVYSPPAAQSRTAVFSGAMDSWSNVDGISFMMDEVWPALTAICPEAGLRVVGRNPPQSLIDRAADRKFSWEFTGFVEDVRPHIRAADVAVIPLRVGSGTRLKAFEAMALGRPVVSTTIGMEGLPVIPGEHYVAANGPREFAQAIGRLMNDSTERYRIAVNARRLLESRYSWSHIGLQFEDICRRTLLNYRARTG